MITILDMPRPPRYSKIVIQVFSAAQSGWCDYRDLLDRDDQATILDELRTLYSGLMFRLVTRNINDVVLAD